MFVYILFRLKSSGVLNTFPCRFIYLEDITRFMQEDEALKTMSLLEGSPESEKINKSSLKNWVVRTGKSMEYLSVYCLIMFAFLFVSYYLSVCSLIMDL